MPPDSRRPLQWSREQQAIIRHREGPAWVQAGSGTGKTTMIEARTVHLVRHRGVPADDILVLVFSDQVATETARRLEAALDGEATLPTVQTVHAWGLGIIRTYWKDLGFNAPPHPLGNREAGELLEGAATTVSGKHTVPASRVRQIITYARNAGVTLAKATAKVHPTLGSHRGYISKVADAYREAKKGANAVDFEDMLVLPWGLLKNHPRIAQAVATQYRYVMVDEFQDLNHPQLALLGLMGRHNRNLMVFLDDLQQIFGWRGARHDPSRWFQRTFPDCRRLSLTHTHRLTRQVAALANAIARGQGGGGKPLRSTRNGPTPVYGVAKTRRDMVRFVRGKVAWLHQKKAIPWEEIAVLARHARGLEEVARGLRDDGIPTQTLHYRVSDHRHRQEFAGLVGYLIQQGGGGKHGERLDIERNPPAGPVPASFVGTYVRRARSDSRPRVRPFPASDWLYNIRNWSRCGLYIVLHPGRHSITRLYRRVCHFARHADCDRMG
jgi:DNA helicase-2/ATP-dependent DNA helicase PcrA